MSIQETLVVPVEKKTIVTFSNEVDKIFPAIVKFRGEIGGAKKNANNPFFNSDYTDLSETLKVVQEPAFNNGLAIVPFPTVLDFVDSMVKEQVLKPMESQYGKKYEKLVWTGKYLTIKVKEVNLIVYIMHESGQWIRSEYSEIPEDNSHHARGKAITYACRYCIKSICGIPSEDNDGNPILPKAKELPKNEDNPPSSDTSPEPTYILDSRGNKRFNTKRNSLDDPYQKEFGLISTAEWLIIYAAIIKKLNGNVRDFRTWVKGKYGYEFFDLKSSQVKEVVDVINTKPGEIIGL